MNLLSFLAILFLMSTVFDESVEELSEQDAEPPTIDKMQLQARFDESSIATVKSGKQRYGKSDTYSSVQTYTPDDTVFAKSLQTRIVGGTVAKHDDIPWQASVKILYKDGNSSRCGASIIDEFWLISAAHCFIDAVQVNVTVGDLHLDTKDDDEQTFTVYRPYSHEEYNSTTDDNDIALLRINPSNNGKGIVFNKCVQPIRLPDAGMDLKEGTMLLVSGWGGTLPCANCANETQVYSKILLKAEVPIFDQKECDRLYFPQYNVTKRMVCAGYMKGQIDTCAGDSGGPAAYQQAGHCVLYGIVSWGGGCAQPERPGVYSRVTEFLPWIEDTMKTNRQSDKPQ